jgi:hypothetical protein
MPDSDSDTIWALTSWGLVARAAEGGKEADTAWATLMERYREPVQRAGRRILRGHPATGQILEEFAGYVFEHGLVGRTDPERGHFRCYIQGVVRRFVLDLPGGSSVHEARRVGPSSIAKRLDQDSPRPSQLHQWH